MSAQTNRQVIKMKEVDWDIAPSGATHYNAKCGFPWLKETPASYFNGDYWIEYREYDSNAKRHIRNAVKRPQEWDGVGLPPVGTVCEYRVNKDEWVSCEVLQHLLRSNDDVEVFVSLKNSWDYSSAPDRFRPTKTSEQVAAEERSLAIKEMCEVASKRNTKGLTLMESLYDAGYRKVKV
jgi:hypothetical protein